MTLPTDQGAYDDSGVVAELDRLNAACRADPGSIDHEIRLWQAVTRLDQWVLVDRGEPGSPRPYAIAAEQGHVLCIYSTPERARAGALAGGLIAPDASAPMFSVPLPQALDWALSLGERGVVGVTLDYPQVGAFCPLPNLERLRSARAAE
ncbi:hypothetical protein ACFJGV_13785 [Cnuibacter sp. UC19_7]|uniref:hypothetical protein n=1 Tax=Cnuibacter sp. UC19_7 TaxID=3350166 RepID=UPI00366FBF30